MIREVRAVAYQETKPFILGIHYAKRMPSISFSFGLYLDGALEGVVTYGSPASPWLCKGVCGEQWRHNVVELNRLVLQQNRPNDASFLVGNSLRLLQGPKIIVSYADSAQNHVGFIYQATNFLFTGTTKPRTDMASKDGKHSRHHLGDRENRVTRSAKHRYVFFVGNKTEKRLMRKDLKYPVLPYPKNKEKRND